MINTIMFCASITCWALTVFVLVRSPLIYKHCKKAIDTGKMRILVSNKTYSLMMLQLWKWRYKDFFKENP